MTVQDSSRSCTNRKARARRRGLPTGERGRGISGCRCARGRSAAASPGQSGPRRSRSSRRWLSTGVGPGALFVDEHAIVALYEKFAATTTDVEWISALHDERGWAVRANEPCRAWPLRGSDQRHVKAAALPGLSPAPADESVAMQVPSATSYMAAARPCDRPSGFRGAARLTSVPCGQTPRRAPAWQL